MSYQKVRKKVVLLVNKILFHKFIIFRLFEAIFSRMFKVWLHPDIIFYRTKLGKEMMGSVEYVHSLTDDVIY